MKTYKNYMVVEYYEDEDITDWVIGDFSDFETARAFCEAYISRHGKRIEVQGTDEDLDVCVNIDTLYVKDVASGSCVNFQELKEYNPRLLKIAMNEQLWDEGREGQERIITNLIGLSNLSGCYNIIEYLLQTIDDILND